MRQGEKEEGTILAACSKCDCDKCKDDKCAYCEKCKKAKAEDPRRLRQVQERRRLRQGEEGRRHPRRLRQVQEGRRRTRRRKKAPSPASARRTAIAIRRRKKAPSPASARKAAIRKKEEGTLADCGKCKKDKDKRRRRRKKKALLPDLSISIRTFISQSRRIFRRLFSCSAARTGIDRRVFVFQLAGTMIDVVCGVIQDAAGRFLACLRPQGKHLAGFWEFPGGKVDPGESPENALIRELREELELMLRWRVRSSRWSGTTTVATSACCRFCAAITGGCPRAVEHERLLWCATEDFLKLDWAEADLPILDELRAAARKTSN